MSAGRHAILSRFPAPAVALALTALGAGATGWALSSRLAGTTDSLNYLIAARALVEDGALRNASGYPFTQYGPGYPVTLAAVSQLGFDLLTAARVVAAASLAVSAVVAGLWTRILTRSDLSAPIGALLAVLIWPALMTRAVWSEPLFIAMVLGAGCCLSRAMQTRSELWFTTGGLLIGLAALTRYSGLVLLLAGVPVLTAWGGNAASSRWRAAAAFALPAGAPAGLWILHNVAVESAEPLGPRSESAFSVVTNLEGAAIGTANLLSPPGIPVAFRFVLLLAVSSALLISVVSLRRRRGSRWWVSMSLPFVLAALLWTGTVFGAMTTNLDALSDNRLLVPAYPPFAVGTTAVLWSAWASRHIQPNMRRRLARAAAVSIPPTLMLLVALGATLRYGTALSPRERLSPSNVSSAIFEATAGYGEELVLSDSPLDTAWAADTEVQRLPVAGTDSVKLIHHGSALLVWTEEGDPSQLQQIQQLCEVKVLESFPDGTLYRVDSC